MSSIELRMIPEAVVQRRSLKRLFLKISENSKKNTYAGVSFAEAFNLIKKKNSEKENTFFYRTPLVAASVISIAVDRGVFRALPNVYAVDFLRK